MKNGRISRILQLPYLLTLLFLPIWLGCCGIQANADLGGMMGSATSAAVSGSTSGSTGGATPSFTDQRTSCYGQNVQTGVEEKAIQGKTESGSDPANQYKPVQMGGMTSSTDPQYTEQPSPTVAKQAQPNQAVTPDPTKQKLFTQYPPWVLNNYGPPKATPFRVDPLSNPQPTGNNGFSPAAFQNNPLLKGAPASDLVSQESTFDAAHRAAGKMLNPNIHQYEAQLQGGTQSLGQATSAAGTAQFSSNLATCQTYLINVANENAGAATSSSADTKTLPQAIWMVQQMFHAVYLPMAFLLVLPGAVLSQWKSVVRHGVMNADSESPFTGILRGAVAVFLIPATQVIVSYGIDVGNSLTYEITQQIDVGSISSWTNAITNPDAALTQTEKTTKQQAQSSMDATMQASYSSMQMLLNNGLMILAAYQVIMACYLFLMGPLAASFLAYPESIGNLFRPVFSGWLDGLLNLVLWRFWWSVILLVMSTRLQWLGQMGEPTNGPWETLVFAAFMVMLTYVPFMALDFRPGDMVDQLMEKTQASNSGSASGGASAGAPSAAGAAGQNFATARQGSIS
jgi:hypothetical protein